MTTLEKIKTILLEYGNPSLSYGMELKNGDQVMCDPKRNLCWYRELHDAAPDRAGYTEEVINGRDEPFLHDILVKLKILALHEERKAYQKKTEYLKAL